MKLAPITLVLIALAGCGARTALEEPPARDREDSGVDAARDAVADTARRDSAVDTRVDLGPDVEPCPPCDDGLFCTGVEICIEDGCMSVAAPTCDDGDECTVDRCDGATDACVNEPVDRDMDGDGITGCAGDCDDSNPLVFPGAAETCNGADDDCDGRADEGVLSECGDCRPCNIVDIPREVGGDWDRAGSTSEGTEQAADGTLRLSSTRVENRVGWIANTMDGTLTKLDLLTGAQTAEFDSVLEGPDNDAPPITQLCVIDRDRGNCPSRTAVDLRGNVFVANRAFGNQGTVTKIANREEDCIDRNGNGRIDTSRDLNADGLIDRSTDEFLGQDDECLLWTVDVGEPAGIPRAIAIDADGFVWVGLFQAREVLKLDPMDGRVLETISLRRGFEPYGAAISGDGTLWLASVASGSILGIDTRTGDVGPVRAVETRDGCRFGGYGIAVDNLDRVWIAGFLCPNAMRYDPELNNWFIVSLPESGGTRGIAADDRGFIYIAASHTTLMIGDGGLLMGDPVSRVTRFRAEDGSDVRIYGTPDAPLPGLATVGVGLDPDRNVWMVNQDSGTATRLNPDTGAVREFPVGGMPYTYSDFTGFALRTFTAPNGFWRTRLQGCAMGPTEWESLEWDARTPAGSRVEARVRTAPRSEDLDTAGWLGPFTDIPIDLAAAGVSADRFMEVELTLVSEDEETSPSVRSASVQFSCPAG